MSERAPSAWLIKMHPGEPFEWCRTKVVADRFRAGGSEVVNLYADDVPALLARVAELEAALLRVEVLHNALAEAHKGIKLLEDLTACGSDDDYVLALKKTVEAALGSTTEPVASPPAGDAPVWNSGAPSHPWSTEWFIAETTFGDRVVLRGLPEDFIYDFKTADETYIKADRIKKWMPFFDSQFVAPPATPRPERLPATDKGETS